MCIFLKCSTAELPVLSSHIQRFYPLNMEIPDIFLCDHFLPKFSFALNNSPSDEIIPTERLILWSLENVSHLKSYKCAATETQSSFWCNCCYYVEFLLVLSVFCLLPQLTPALPLPPRPHVMWCLIWLGYCIVGSFCRRGDDMWQCSSVQATHQHHSRKLSVISAPLTPSGPDCWRWGTRDWTSKLQHQLPPNQHSVETPAQVQMTRPHMGVWTTGGWIQAPS